MGHLRSAILELLTLESAPVLVTPEGKETLKKKIKARTSELLKDQKVIDVLFSEFVVQF
jgi:flagellar basal body-associated protein FliL